MTHGRYLSKILSIKALVVLLAGCSSTGRYSAIQPPRPLGVAYAAVEATAGKTTNTVVSKVLKLPDVLALALQGNPDLTAFSFEVRVAEGRMLQAGLLPNPEFELEVDEYDRDGARFDSAETAVVFGQLFELGGKRKWRKRIARTEGELEGWDYESKRLDVLAETAKRFVTVLAQQERIDLAHAAAELAEETNRAVNERVEAGKDPPFQAAKSHAELEMARLEAANTEEGLAAARRKLAAMWGAQQAGFEQVQGNLHQLEGAVPPLDALRPYLAQNPKLARWETELRLRHATLSSEKAARIPDLQGSVGFVRYEEDGTDALAFSVGLPLPIFDRNQGNIAAATHGLAKAEAERSATEIALSAELAEAHASVMVAYQRVSALRGTVVPAMEKTFLAAREGYQQGKFGFLDMLDAQRSLFESQAVLLDAHSGYQSAMIDIQRLIGTDIDTLMNAKKEEQKYDI